MKFTYSREAAELIAEELMSTIPVLASETVVVHVPTITSHIRQRGFDHAALVASLVAQNAQLRHLPALARSGQARQVGSSRTARLQQTKDVFRLKQTFAVAGCRVLLVDDVYTTGATIESAAHTLRGAGAARVDAAVFARAK